MTYLEAVDWLCRMSKWRRQEVIADGESAGWFVAQRTDDETLREEAHRAGRIVAGGQQ